jgi:nitric-oxide synthase
VFALGSSAYPNFCSFGKYIDNILGELGGERLMKLSCGDEMCGQEQEFHKWAPTIFKIACDTFCLDVDDMNNKSICLKSELLTIETIRLSPATEADKNETLDKLLSKYHSKKVKICQVKQRPMCLHGNGKNSDRATVLVEIIATGV